MYKVGTAYEIRMPQWNVWFDFAYKFNLQNIEDGMLRVTNTSSAKYLRPPKWPS